MEAEPIIAIFVITVGTIWLTVWAVGTESYGRRQILKTTSENPYCEEEGFGDGTKVVKCWYAVEKK